MSINIISKLSSQENDIINNNKIYKTEQHPYVEYKDKICIKPWGYEFMAYQSKHIAIWILSINQGHKTSLHTHFQKDTTLIVLNGCAKLNLIDDEIALPIMSITNIPKYKFHGIEGLSDETLIMEIEIFSRAIDFSDKNDVLRIDDAYDREKIGYESSVNISTDLDQFKYFYFTNGFENDIFKVFQTGGHHTISSDKLYILIDGVANDCGMYIKEGSILKPSFLEQISNEILVLEINKPYYQEDAKIIYNLEQLKMIVDQYKNKNLILTSGCFDIMHIGHIHNLKSAKLLGDKLFVCLSNDKQIKALKGDSRPINNYNDRIQLFKTIQYVDYVILYDECDIENETTLDKIINIVKPHYWVKGSDYDKNQILKKHPTANVKLIDNVPYISTTQLISNIINK